MRVVLPHPSLLFYDQALPQLSRRPSEAAAASALPAPPQTPPSSSPCSSASLVSARRSLASPGSSSSAAAAAAAGAAPQGSLPPAGALGGDAEDAPAAAADGGAVGRWLQRLRRRRLLRLHGSRTVPVGELLQPTVLQNKAPHWNEGLRCWCLNFRGRVKLASVKNFQVWLEAGGGCGIGLGMRSPSAASCQPRRRLPAHSLHQAGECFGPALLSSLCFPRPPVARALQTNPAHSSDIPPPPSRPRPPPPQHTHTHTHTHTTTTTTTTTTPAAACTRRRPRRAGGDAVWQGGAGRLHPGLQPHR